MRRVKGNRYSVPRPCAFRVVTVKAYLHEVHLVADGCVVARHVRSYERAHQILDPLHYLATLGRRPAALDHSNVYRGWHLPPEFAALRAALEVRHGATAAARQYVRVLQLLAHHPVERVQDAIRTCDSSEALLAERILREADRLAQRQPDGAACLNGLDPTDPILAVQVRRPDLSQFDQLLSADFQPQIRDSPGRLPRVSRTVAVPSEGELVYA